MNTYVYKGVTENGNTIGGANRFGSKEKMDIYVSTLKLSNVEVYQSQTPFNLTKKNYVLHQDMSVFCKEMSMLYNANYSFIDSIKIVSEKIRNKALSKALTEIHGFMINGKTFAQAVVMYQHIFGKYFVGLICSCEETESFGIVFEELSDFFEKSYFYRRKIKQILLYPITLISMVSIILFVFYLKIIPTFYEVLPYETNKNLLKTIDTTAYFLENYIIYFFTFVGAVFFGILLYFRAKKGREILDFIATITPFYKGIHNNLESYKFIRAMYLMMKYGLDIETAYSQAIMTIENSYNKKELEKALVDIKRGQNFADSIADTGIFPNVYLNLIDLGETTNNMYEVFDKVSKNLENDVEYNINKFASIVEPIVSLTLLIIIILIFINILNPVLNIINLL